MRNRNIIFTVAILASLILSACASLLTEVEEAVGGDYGPVYSVQEHQTRTFEAMWSNLEDTYIYYETADVTWDAIHEAYLGRINAGLTNEEFSAQLHELETDLPTGAFIYQSRAERIEADTLDVSTYEGIGAIIGFQEEEIPHIVILDIIEGSPAEKAGLKPHDSIFEIDGNPVLLEEGLSAVNRVRGPSGSTVTLTVQSPGKAERAVDVQRGKLTSTGKLESMQIPGTSFGYMLLPPIAYDALGQDVLQALQTLTTNQKLDGLILDLRIAGSSRSWPLEGLFTIFYNGAIGEFYNRTDKQLVQVKGEDAFGSQTVPLVILVGPNTQGLPEILAASLQMHKRATVIGAITPGAVESTSVYYLPDGARIFVETTSFILPNGDEVGNNGVSPNVEIEAGWDEITPSDDPVIDSAVEALEAQQ